MTGRSRPLPALVALVVLAACAGGGPAAGGPVARPAPRIDAPSPPGALPDATSTTGEPAIQPQVAFLSGLMPLRSTGVPEFLAAHPTYDGRGVLIAILDSGIDAGTYGLITTSAGGPKILDLRDFSGEGRIALTPVTPGGDGTVAVDGQQLHGTGRIGRLTSSNSWYAGVLRELPLGSPPAADLNGNGTSTDVFAVIVVRAADGWVAFIDSNRDGSFEDEMPLHDYREGRETIALGTRPITIVANFAEVGGAPLLDLLFDTSGHGTHVAGIAAGHNLFNVGRFHGVAPGAQIIGLKIANNARGDVSVHGSMRRAMEYAARFARLRNLPLVLNMSFGVGNEPPGRAVIDSLANAFLVTHPGVVFVVSAGNDGPGIGTLDFPGSADLALTVGASFPGAFARPAQPGIPAADDVPGWWSSRGGAAGEPDLVAPGIAYSSVPAWDRGNEIKGGTSMAAPHVAGLAACLMSALVQEGRPVGAAEIVQALRVSAVPFPGLTVIDQGSGVPRLEAAYRWLLAGHQGSGYQVRTRTGGSGAVRRDGFAGPGDTVDTFRVRHMVGLRAAQYQLQADVPWLSVPALVAADPGGTDIAVSYRPAPPGGLSAPGLYVGRVIARNPNDTLAGPLFTLVSTVVVPFDLPAKPLVDERRVVPRAAVQRYFLRVPHGGTTLQATVVIPDSGRQTAIVKVFEPTGRPYRDAGEDLPLGREDGGTLRVTVRGEDLVPGVYEIDVLAPPLNSVTVSVRAEVSGVAVSPTMAAGELELTNPGPGSAAVRVVESLIGAERIVEVAGRGLPAESVTVRVPEWAVAVEVDVDMPREQWGAFTDFAATVLDTAGHAVHHGPLNYAFGRQRVPVSPAMAGRALVVELYPAYAVPEMARGWRAVVRVRFLLETPVPIGRPRELNVVAGGRMTTAVLESPPALALPEGFTLLSQVVAEPQSGAGATAVRRVTRP
jgi:tripeptidyl-peptidase II